MDDHLRGNAFTRVGVILRDETEAAALADLQTALRSILDEEGRVAPDAKLLDSPRWPEVVEKARIALAALERP